MIIEVRDITGKQTATGHCAFPSGTTLGEVFARDARLRAAKKRIVKVQLNGADTPNWEEIHPEKHDKVTVILEPGEYISLIISIIVAVISIVRFIISLVNQPKSPKLQQPTPTYAFEGLRNTFTPGNVVPVLYGEHEAGGQVLMYYVDVIDKKKEKFYELLAVSEGELDSCQKIFVNQIASTEIAEVETDFRLGTSSQSIIPGFERIKNTFYDGRDFTKDMQETGSQSIVYPTVSNDVEGVDLQVFFPDGIGAMRTVGAEAGSIRKINIDYAIRYSVAGQNQWSEKISKRNAAANRQPFIDNFHLDFPKPGAWDIEVWWDKSNRRPRYGTDFFRTILLNVTEYRGEAGAFSGTALVAVKGVGSKKVQGGQPLITSIWRGRKVRIYTSPSSYFVGWTQNPAWCMRDYMTNSVYGMGPYITDADIHIPSFLEFAELADSQTVICDDTVDACSKSASDAQAIMGDPRIYTAFAPGNAPDPLTRPVLPNPAQDPIRFVSTAFSTPMAGIINCHQCCPHGDFPFVTGVRTPDRFCDRPEITAEFRGSSGHGVAGFGMHMYSGATWDNYTGYAFIYNEGLHKIAVARYNNQSVATTGTILAQASVTLSPGNVVHFLVEPPVYGPQSANFPTSANHALWVSVARSWGGVFTDLILGARDALPNSGGLNNEYGTNLGGITMPVSESFPSLEPLPPKLGGYNDQLWDQFTNVCGTCYCEPTLIDWGCDDPAIANCDNFAEELDPLCGLICPYGQFAQIEYDGSLQPGGIAIRVPETATSADFTGLMAIYVPDQTTVAVYVYSHTPINTEGSLLSFVSQTMNSGDILKLQVASGQTEVYQTYRNSSLLITSSVTNARLDIFNDCVWEIRSGSALSPTNGANPPTIATTYFPGAAGFPTAPTSYYQTCGDTFV